MRRATESNQNGIRYVHNVHCSENHYNETILPIIMIRCIGMCLLQVKRLKSKLLFITAEHLIS